MKMKIAGCILLTVLTVVLFSIGTGMAGEKSLMDCSRQFYASGEYYNAVTEAMRYQYMFPRGAHYPESLILMGKALYLGGDYSGAVISMEKCSVDYKDTAGGEEAQYLLGRMRLGRGAPLFAVQSFNSYLNIYGDSLFTERVYRDRCYAAALDEDFGRARRWIEEYKRKYPAGDYLAEVDGLSADMGAEESRPKKSFPLAVMGSVVMPGFGYFYTGNYKLGTFSLLSNACFIALAVNGALTGNIFQLMFFGLIELSFYQNSIYGAMRSVAQYNSTERFTRRLRLQVQQNF